MEIKAILGKDLINKLFVDGIHLETKLRKNMKKKAFDFMDMDKVHLKERVIIESLNDVLKNNYQL